MTESPKNKNKVYDELNFYHSHNQTHCLLSDQLSKHDNTSYAIKLPVWTTQQTLATPPPILQQLVLKPVEPTFLRSVLLINFGSTWEILTIWSRLMNYISFAEMLPLHFLISAHKSLILFLLWIHIGTSNRC